MAQKRTGETLRGEVLVKVPRCGVYSRGKWTLAAHYPKEKGELSKKSGSEGGGRVSESIPVEKSVRM